MSWTDVVVTYLLVLFLWSALAKGTRIGQFKGTVQSYGIRNNLVAQSAALSVMVSEWLVVLLLLFPPTQRPALGLAAFLLFTFAIVGTIRRQKDGAVDCGCLGPRSSLLLTPANTVVNGVSALTGLTAALILNPRPIAISAVPFGLLLAGIYWLTLYAFSVVQRMSGSLAGRQREEQAI